MFSLYLPFDLPSDQSFHEALVPADIDGRCWTLRKGTPPAFHVSGFSSEGDARDYLPRARLLLEWLMLNSGIFIDAAERVREVSVAKGPSSSVMMADGGSAAVYPSSITLRTMFGTATIGSIFHGSSLLDALRRASGLSLRSPNDDPKLIVALDLYRSHGREASTTSQFITLITVLEALAKPAEREKAVVEMLNGWIREIDVVISGMDVNSASVDAYRQLKQDLQRTRRDSISRQIVRVVVNELAASDKTQAEKLTKEVKKMYGVRSKILHEGIADSGELSSALLLARDIVPRVLSGRLAVASGPAVPQG